MLNCSAGLSSTTSKRLRRGVVYSLMRVKAAPSPSGVVGLVTKGEGPARQAVMPVFIQRQHLDRDVPGGRILFQMIEHRPAQHVGQEDIQRYRCGMEFAGQGQGFCAIHRDQHLESRVARQIAQHPRVVRIIFDDQQDRIVGLQVLAVVGDLLDLQLRRRLPTVDGAG